MSGEVAELAGARLLTAAEVAARLRCSPKTVRRMRLRSISIGTGRKRPRVRYRLEDVEAWIRQHAEGR